MIVLKNGDNLRITPSSTNALKVVAYWVDTTTSVFTPDRTLTDLATTSATNVVAGPAASTQRQVKFMTITATGGANTIIIDHHDGSTAHQIGGGSAAIPIADGDTIQYTDTNGFEVLAGDLRKSVDGFDSVNSISAQAFVADGTWTAPAGLKFAIVFCTSAGGGGGGADATGAADAAAGAGGGAGATAFQVYAASTVGASQTVTVGTGGAGGSGTNGTNGTQGGTSSFGALLSCTGGFGGTGSGAGAQNVQTTTGGNGGGTVTGLMFASGQAGGPGCAGLTLDATDTQEIAWAVGGYGGSSFWGGGGRPGATSQDAAAADSTASSQAGVNGAGRGSGGGGGAALNTATGVDGGNGSGGYVVVFEFK